MNIEQTKPSMTLLHDMRTMTYKGKVSLPATQVEARDAREAEFKVLELALEQLIALRKDVLSV